MHTRDVLLANDPRWNTDTGGDVSRKKGFRASIIVWGMPRDASTLEVIQWLLTRCMVFFPIMLHTT